MAWDGMVASTFSTYAHHITSVLVFRSIIVTLIVGRRKCYVCSQSPTTRCVLSSLVSGKSP